MENEVLAMAIGAYVDGKYRNVYDTGLKTARGAPIYVCIDRGHECAVYQTRKMRKRLGRCHTREMRVKQKIRGVVNLEYRIMSMTEGVVQNGRTVHEICFHRLVCYAFHGAPPEPDMEVDHIDYNRKNNHPSNLRWVTKTENLKNKRPWLVRQRARETKEYLRNKLKQ